MATRVLRPRSHINYYEPDEPRFDEYIYCDRCSDYVIEYCAIHGPLLVIPDNKVPSTPMYPSFVPHAALTIPHVFLHLAPSVIPGAGIGVFSTLTLPCGVRFGPYIGKSTNSVDSSYCWQIYDGNNRPSHVLDAANPNNSNWLRYVNCSRHRVEQNLVAYQYRGQLYYRTIKIIPRFTELLVFYGSEFANALRVDLSKYNDISYYKLIINPPKKAAITSRSTIDAQNLLLSNNYETNSQKRINELNISDFLIIDNPVIESVSERNLVDIMDAASKNSTKFNSFAQGNSSLNPKDMIKDNLGQRFQCEQCNKSYLKQKYLKTHSLSHLPTPKYQCSKCPYGTSIYNRFKKHNLIHSKQNVLGTDNVKKSIGENIDQRFQCKQCSKSYKIKDSLRRHVLSHLPTPKYKCPKCPYGTSFSYTLRKHYLIHSKPHNIKQNIDQIFQCDHCNKSFKKKDYIRTHMLSHLPTPKYQCPDCSYGTSLSHSFKRHYFSMHSNEKTRVFSVNKVLKKI